jgi:hypothetical protein
MKNFLFTINGPGKFPSPVLTINLVCPNERQKMNGWICL